MRWARVLTAMPSGRLGLRATSKGAEARSALSSLRRCALAPKCCILPRRPVPHVLRSRGSALSRATARQLPATSAAPSAIDSPWRAEASMDTQDSSGKPNLLFIVGDDTGWFNVVDPPEAGDVDIG